MKNKINVRTQHTDILAVAKARQDFTANVSHELKTPLTAISGYAELLESGMVGEEKKNHFYQEIKTNADRLIALINDIIKLSELDRVDHGLNAGREKNIFNRIRVTGMKIQDYVAQRCMYNQISVVGNIKTFDAIRNEMKTIDKHLMSLKFVDELELEKLESLRMILEILEGFYKNCDL